MGNLFCPKTPPVAQRTQPCFKETNLKPLFTAYTHKHKLWGWPFPTLLEKVDILFNFLALFPKETEDTTNIVEDLSINMKHGNGARNSLSGKIVLADTETQDVNGEEVQDGHVDQEKQN